MIDPDMALRIVRESKVISYDTETTGVDTTSRPVGYVVADFDNSVYVPVGHEAGGNIPDREGFERALNFAFSDRSRSGYRTVGHNLGFDLRMSGWRGIYPKGPLEDTMLNESLIDDTTRGYGLDDCCARHKVAAKKGAALYVRIAERFGGLPDRSSMKHFWRMPGDDEEVVDYSCGDGVSTLALWASQQPILDAEELRVPWQLECDLLPYVARMHLRGMKIDHEYGDSLIRPGGIFDQRIEKAAAAFSAGFNTNSPKEVEALFRSQGFTDADFDWTSGNPPKPSFTEKWLETVDIGKKILDVRRMKKARDSFAMPLLVNNNINGRVHATLNQSKSDEYGVSGSRFSCSDPNLQAFPKRNKDVGRVVRRLVVADDGMVLEEADAKQQEPRFFAWFSDDERLRQGYITGTLDIHDIAMKDFDLPRDSAKRLGLGMLTGMQPNALAGHMRWDLPRAAAAHAKFLTDAFPAIGAFQRNAKSIFKSTGFVRSILGRKARCDDPKFAYRAVSRIIQNSGGDHVKACLLIACQYGDAHPDYIQMLMTIHDSLIWQRDPTFDRSELIRAMEAVPHDLFRMDIPIPFEIGTATDWATASYGK